MSLTKSLSWKQESGTFLKSKNRDAYRNSPSSPSGFSTPPIVMPETPMMVVDRDLEFAASEKHMESKDWAMRHRLSVKNRTKSAESSPQHHQSQPQDSTPETTDEEVFSFEF
mmetsp:Transcript_31144/g.36690  ORF Transcript_31144/g.36690 Transcript_31144/m.36690 type:complete len:112 (-) Transcript_31144:109-444(-)